MEKKRDSKIFFKAVMFVISVMFISGSHTTPVGAQPAPAGEIRIAMTSLGNETMDPVITSNSGKPLMTLLYDYVIGVDPDGKLSKNTGVARDWKLSPDSLSFTIYVRPGVKFHNGDDLTAADVKFSMEQFMSDRSVSSQKNQMTEVIKRIETPDPLTVVIYFKKPSVVMANFLSRQMGVEGSVLPKKYIEKNGAEYFNRNPVGSGPYRFVEHKTGSHIKYEAVSYPHWRVGVPKIKAITFYYVKEESTGIAMLKTGDVDITGIGRDRIKDVSNYRLYEKKGDALVALYVNNSWDPNTFLSNPKFREALSISINRKEIKDFIFGGKAEILGSGIVYGSYAIDYKSPPVDPYDPERAKKLVQEAFPNKKPELKMYVYPREGVPEVFNIGEAIAGYWEKIGVKIKIIQTDFPTYRKMHAAKNSPELANCVAVMTMGNRLLWDAAFRHIFHTDGLLSCAKDPKLDAMIEQLLAEKDPNKIAPRSYEIATYLNRQHYQIPLMEVGLIYAADPKKVPAWPHLSTPLAYDLYLDDLFMR
jgi:peptide/nickel transport system substrate-binding protein